MDEFLFEQLLNESESDCLDFKKEQYRFIHSKDIEQKSELLKDILAFANAWRRSDAYILIGVNEVKGGRNEVLGISVHIDDASIQEFVNHKTNTPVIFSYSTFEYGGQQVGIIHIPIQERPFFLKNDCGHLKKNTVYIRRGTSTFEATPAEIAKIGASNVKDTKSQIPQFECEFSDPEKHKLLGKDVELSTVILVIEEKIPDFNPAPNSDRIEFSLVLNTPNKNYYRELRKFYDQTCRFTPISLRLKNIGQVMASNVHIEINLAGDDVEILNDEILEDRPRRYFESFATFGYISDVSSVPPTSNISIEKYEDSVRLKINFGNIKPKAEAWLDELLYFGSRKPMELQIDALIFADNLPDPIHQPLSIRFNTTERKITVPELEAQYQKLIEEEIKAVYDEDE